MKKITYLASLFILLLCYIPNTMAEGFPTTPPWQLSTQAGKSISLSDYQGKPVILHFWATWCPYCKKLQPKLVELENKYQSSGLKIVSISFNEDDGATPQDEINKRGYDFITAVKGELVAKRYGVRGTPTTFFINRQGKVIYKSTSSNVNNPKFELAVQEIIKP
ncbi:MAG: TlpA family protein disulfide reductase [Colwellia sp.]|nr:TlpA family protein disulfide reductase [Colwellia sp.]